MDKVLDALFWILNAFSHTRDPFLAKHRGIQRHFIVSAFSTVLAMGALYFISPLDLAENPYRPVVQAVVEPVSWVLLMAMAISMVWLTWATYALWRFESEHK